MTNKIETVCEQLSALFQEFAKEMIALKEELADLQVQSNKHESLKDELKNVLNRY